MYHYTSAHLLLQCLAFRVTRKDDRSGDFTDPSPLHSDVASEMKLSSTHSSWQWRYASAISSVLLATLVRLGLQPILHENLPFVFYFLAVIFTSWFGGVGPALVAIVLGSLLTVYLFLPPQNSWVVSQPDDLLGLIFYFIAGLAIAVLSEQLRHARHLAEEKAQTLAEREEWLSTILHSIGDAVVTTDTQGVVTFINPVAEAITGWRAEQALGQPSERLVTIVDAETRQAINHPATRALGQGATGAAKSRVLLVTRDGREIPVEASATPIRDSDAQATGVVVVFHDISEREAAEQHLRASEARFRELWENANDIFYTLDLRGNLTSINQAGERVFGYPREELLHRPIHGHIVPEYLEQMQEMVQRKVEGQQVTTYELEMVTKDESRVVLEVSSRLIYRDGQPSGIQGVARNVTERKQAERERADLLLREQAARAEAEQALRYRDEFLAIASHELKTPLTTIIGYVSLLQRRAERNGSQPGDERALQAIAQQSDRLHKLIELLLDVSRMKSGQLQIALVPIDLSALVRRWAESAEPMLDQHTLNLVAPTHPVIILGDELRLEQVFQNLVQNAIKYSPEGGTITIRLEHEAARACLSITDQGIGIPADELPKLFDRFYRAGNFDGFQIGGMGVGLFVVKEIVGSHSGTVHIESQEGQGSTFQVFLPLHNRDGAGSKKERLTA